MRKIILLMLITAVSCGNRKCDWGGGEIIDFGEYCNGEFKIDVYEENDYLKYEVRNRENALVIKQDMNISVFQRWGLFLDKKGNFWILSSDVGIYLWERNPATGSYSKKTFYHKLSRDEVPAELYESSLKRFL